MESQVPDSRYNDVSRLPDGDSSAGGGHTVLRGCGLERCGVELT